MVSQRLILVSSTHRRAPTIQSGHLNTESIKAVAFSDGTLHAMPAFVVLTFEYKVAEMLA